VIIKVAVKPKLNCMDELLLTLKNLMNSESFKSYWHSFIFDGFYYAQRLQILYCVEGYAGYINPEQSELNIISSGNSRVLTLNLKHYIKY